MFFVLFCIYCNTCPIYYADKNSRGWWIFFNKILNVFVSFMFLFKKCIPQKYLEIFGPPCIYNKAKKDETIFKIGNEVRY